MLNNDAEIEYNNIGRRLRELRGKLSQTAFGEPLGYKYSYVKDCEHGKKPSLEYLFKVSNYYSASLDWLIKGIESIRANESGVDTELDEMYDVLKFLMQNFDPNLRGWAIVQFRKSFAEYFSVEDGKIDDLKSEEKK